MRTVDPDNMATARRLGARRLHYTAVSAAIRDTGRPGGGDWSVIYNCAVPGAVHLRRCDRSGDGAAGVPRPARSLQRRAPRHRGGAAAGAPADHRRQYLAARARAGLLRRGDQAARRRRARQPTSDRSATRRSRRCSAAPRRCCCRSNGKSRFRSCLPESMLCGTPLIAFRRGGVPEGIDHGRTGFLCDTVDEMTALVSRLPETRPRGRACRSRAAVFGRARSPANTSSCIAASRPRPASASRRRPSDAPGADGRARTFRPIRARRRIGCACSRRIWKRPAGRPPSSRSSVRRMRAASIPLSKGWCRLRCAWCAPPAWRAAVTRRVGLGDLGPARLHAACAAPAARCCRASASTRCSSPCIRSIPRCSAPG